MSPQSLLSVRLCVGTAELVVTELREPLVWQRERGVRNLHGCAKDGSDGLKGQVPDLPGQVLDQADG